MNAIGRLVALLVLFLSFNLTGAAQTSPAIGSTASPQATDKVIISTTVINEKANLVTGLQRDNFQVSIDKKPAQIVDFREQDVPLSVGIVFDASASVVGDRLSAKSTRALINSAQQAMKGFVDMSNPSNEYFLMAFNNRPQLLLDWTSNSKGIIDTLGVLQPKGNTAFYDACYLAIDKVRHGRYSKHVLILITDGLDNNSSYSFAQVLDELRASDVLTYSVYFSVRGTAGSTGFWEGQEILKQFTLVSGGMLFYRRFLTASDAVSIFEMIATELRHQYTIALMPNLSSDNKWHKIKIKVEASANAPDEMKHLSARTREGFYLNHR